MTKALPTAPNDVQNALAERLDKMRPLTPERSSTETDAYYADTYKAFWSEAAVERRREELADFNRHKK